MTALRSVFAFASCSDRLFDRLDRNDHRARRSDDTGERNGSSGHDSDCRLRYGLRNRGHGLNGLDRGLNGLRDLRNSACGGCSSGGPHVDAVHGA